MAMEDFGVRFRREESKVMMVNRSEDESNAVWRVGENELNERIRREDSRVKMSWSQNEKVECRSRSGE